MRHLLLFAALLLSTAALAQAPRTPPTVGFWWNPGESGRGWNIEVQNDVVAITHFVYRPDGSAVFWQSAGPFNLDTGVITATLNQVDQGQCVGCAYTRPTTTSLGTVRFEFANDSQGRVIYPNGTTIDIRPFVYGYANPLAATFGTWSTNWAGVSGNLFSGIFQFYAERQIDPSLRAAEGRRLFPTGNRPVLASEVQGVYLIVADTSSSFNEIMYVTANVRDFSGVACVFSKGSTPPAINACRGAAYGARILSDAQSRRIFPSTSVSDDAKSRSTADAALAAEHATASATDTSFAHLSPALSKAAQDPSVQAAAAALADALTAPTH